MIPAWFRCEQQTEDGIKMVEVYKFQKEIHDRLVDDSIFMRNVGRAHAWMQNVR